MKLSEAIRIGASKTGKWKNGYFSPRGAKTCAFGAALVGMGYGLEALDDNNIDTLLGVETSFVWFNHPLSSGEFTLFTIVTDLNDNRDWSRKRIADWLESIGY